MDRSIGPIRIKRVITRKAITESLDSTMRVGVPGSEMISELYVPRKELASFFADMREDFRTMSKRFTARSA